MDALVTEVEALLARLRTEHGVSVSIDAGTVNHVEEPSPSLGMDLITEVLDHIWSYSDDAGESKGRDETKRRLRLTCPAIRDASNQLVKEITFGRIEDGLTRSAWKLGTRKCWQDELEAASKRWPGINRLLLGDRNRSPPISYEVLEAALEMAGREEVWPRLNFIHVICANSDSADPLPPSINSCAHLVKKLEIRAHGNLTDLSQLSRLGNLSDLTIKTCNSLSNIAFLASIASSLQTLYLSFLAVSDLAPLSSLTKLEQLTLGWCSGVTSITSLSCCTTLTSLVVSNCDNLASLDGIHSGLVSLRLDSLNVTSLSQIAKCSHLKDLALISPLEQPNVALSSLSWMSQSLESLTLDNSFSDLDIRSFILSLSPSLTQLVIKEHTELQDESLATISTCSQLRALDLHGCRSLSDLSPLTALSCLKELSIGSCTRIASLAPLSSLVFLKTLSVESLQLSSFAPLASCTNLVSLNISSCFNLQDLEAFSKCHRLRDLNLDGCYRIKSLAPLRCLTELQSLSMMRVSRIRDLSPLQACTHLREIKMSHCERLEGISSLSRLQCLTLKIIGKWHSNGPTDDEIDEPHPDDDINQNEDDDWEEGDGGWDQDDEEGFAEGGDEEEEEEDGPWMEDVQLQDDWPEGPEEELLEEGEEVFDDGDPFDHDNGLGDEDFSEGEDEGPSDHDDYS